MTDRLPAWARQQIEALPPWGEATPGERLRLLRCAQGLRQLDVASRAGIDLRTVQAAEGGLLGGLALDRIGFICSVLGVALPDIFTPTLPSVLAEGHPA